MNLTPEMSKVVAEMEYLIGRFQISGQYSR